MASIIPLDIYAGNFPANYEDTPYNVFKSFLRRLRIDISSNSKDSGNAIVGAISTAGITYDAGPRWVQPNEADAHWHVWDRNTGAYGPDTLQVKNGPYYITLGRTSPATTTDTTATFPDKDGTVALLYDVYVPRATVILTGTTPAIDWSASGDFLYRLPANSSPTFSNVSNGEVISVSVENTGTAYTVTWPAGIKYVTGSQPATPVGSSGVDAMGVWTFLRINSITYAILRNATPVQPNSTVPTGGDAPPDYGQGKGDVNKLPY